VNHFGHIIVGLVAAAAVNYIISTAHFAFFSLLQPLTLTTLIAVAALGALLPDIDLAHSKISKLIGVIFVLLAMFLIQPLALRLVSGITPIASWVVALLISIGLLFAILFPLRLKHRGITHTFEAAVVFGIAIAIVSGAAGTTSGITTGPGITSGLTAGIIGFAGYASHVVVDKL